MSVRYATELEFEFEAGSQVSGPVRILNGAFGTVVIPLTGSPLVGKALQFLAVSQTNAFEDTPLLPIPKTLLPGSNYITPDEIAQVGGAVIVRLHVDTPVASTCKCWLLWKS